MNNLVFSTSLLSVKCPVRSEDYSFTIPKRQILGTSVALSEAEAHWRTFLSSLVQRGLSGVELIVSDDPFTTL